jgi:serine/threonine protein kinase
MVTGLPPFSDEDTPDKQIYDNITNLRYQTPRGATVSCNSLIKVLLVKTPSKRVGCGRAGLLELKRHAWFGGLDWKALIRKEIPAPVVPVLEHDKDTSNYEKYVERDDPEPAMAAGTSDEWADVF